MLFATTLKASASTSILGKPVTFTVAVGIANRIVDFKNTRTRPGLEVRHAYGRPVTFKDGNTVLGTRVLLAGAKPPSPPRCWTQAFARSRRLMAATRTQRQHRNVGTNGQCRRYGASVRHHGERSQPYHPTNPEEPDQSQASLLYNNVINQFAVQYNPRYGEVYVDGVLKKTNCNIFVWDVTSAMGALIPHWVDANGWPAADYQGWCA